MQGSSKLHHGFRLGHHLLLDRTHSGLVGQKPIPGSNPCSLGSLFSGFPGGPRALPSLLTGCSSPLAPALSVPDGKCTPLINAHVKRNLGVKPWGGAVTMFSRVSLGWKWQAEGQNGGVCLAYMKSQIPSSASQNQYGSTHLWEGQSSRPSLAT